MFGLTTWQTVLLGALVLLCLNYLWHVSLAKLAIEGEDREGAEGFEGSGDGGDSGGGGGDAATRSQETWLECPDLYDDYYVSIYDKLAQHAARLQGEVGLILQEWGSAPEAVLDVGCGTGIATAAFAKLGAKQAVGIDVSPSMVRFAKNKTLPGTTLTPEQAARVEYRLGNVLDPTTTTLSPGEFTHACLLYFSLYEIRDLDLLFRNLTLWVQPGGKLAIEVVDKYRFEPVLDSANPWVGVSPQKYSTKRLTRSQVDFDGLSYEAEFIEPAEKDAQGRAEFRETMTFKDGTKRRQKHVLWMPDIKEVVRRASLAGWTYDRSVDLTPLEFPYGYLLFFHRGEVA